MDGLNSVYEILPAHLRHVLEGLPAARLDKLEEIRLRAGKPLALNMADGLFFAAQNAGTGLTKNISGAYHITRKDMADALSLVSEYSPYAFAEEIRNGFITLRGGHRVGICGKAVVEGGEVRTLRSVSSMNIRVSREVKGCAEGVMRHIVKNGRVRHTLVISPPRLGKTTLLRDIIRHVSDGVPELGFFGADVAVVDERAEIAGTFMGMAQNEIGIRTDVLDGCPKAKGIFMLLRSMSPHVIAVDEIGGSEDIRAIDEALNAGVALICTVHGDGIEDVEMKPGLSALIERRVFGAYIVLGGKPGQIEGIYDKEMVKCKC